MSVFTKKLVEATGKKYERVSYEQMVEMVNRLFIQGSDDDFLKKVKSTAKGSFAGTTIHELTSPSGQQSLRVVPVMGSFVILLMGKDVTLIDEEAQCVYDIKTREWKKFYKEIEVSITIEKRSRT